MPLDVTYVPTSWTAPAGHDESNRRSAFTATDGICCQPFQFAVNTAVGFLRLLLAEREQD
jgi:hypothetical protein